MAAGEAKTGPIESHKYGRTLGRRGTSTSRLEIRGGAQTGRSSSAAALPKQHTIASRRTVMRAATLLLLMLVANISIAIYCRMVHVARHVARRSQGTSQGRDGIL